MAESTTATTHSAGKQLKFRFLQCRGFHGFLDVAAAAAARRGKRASSSVVVFFFFPSQNVFAKKTEERDTVVKFECWKSFFFFLVNRFLLI